MRRDATWGGNMELVACSRAYKLNVTVHQLGAPRFDILFDPIVKTIHLAYHDERHYSSIRRTSDDSYKAPEIKVFILFIYFILFYLFFYLFI